MLVNYLDNAVDGSCEGNCGVLDLVQVEGIHVNPTPRCACDEYCEEAKLCCKDIAKKCRKYIFLNNSKHRCFSFEIFSDISILKGNPFLLYVNLS